MTVYETQLAHLIKLASNPATKEHSWFRAKELERCETGMWKGMQVLEEKPKGADFGRAKVMCELRELEAEREQRNGETALRPLRPWPGVAVPPTRADVCTAKAACCGRCGRAIGMAGEGVSL